MCGRYLITSPPDALERLFGILGPLGNLQPRWNVAPTQGVPILRAGGEGAEWATARWGLVPAWAKADEKGRPKVQSVLINARRETAAEKPTFRTAFRQRPAVLPADGFYEWQARGKGPKQPYCIRLKSGEPMAFAGLWEEWESPDGSPLLSAAILTGDAQGDVAGIHHRCPVILPAADVKAWLDPGLDAEARTAFLDRLPSPGLTWHPVSTAVNSIRNDDPSLAEPCAEIEAPREEPPSDDGQMSLL